MNRSVRWNNRLRWAWLCTALLCPAMISPAFAQENKEADNPVRGSFAEDLNARKLLQAGDARLEADETAKAVEVWQSVIERYPRSKVRFDAHMRLGNFLLERERAYDRARTHYEAAAVEDNRDPEQQAEATLKMGVCFYEAGNYGKCFTVMRDVIEKFPVSSHVNQAYYYIGLAHFQLGHYSRAISALEKVGTALTGDDQKIEKVEAGKRLFIRIEDADLSALEPNETIKVLCETKDGDKETLECFSVGRNVRVVLGSLMTSLGKPQPGNGILEVRGDEKVKVTYTDQHTADKTFNKPLNREIQVVGNGIVQITDGAFQETLRGVVLNREVNLQIMDADRDLSDKADTIKAVVEVYREKTSEELENEAAALTARTGNAPEVNADGESTLKIERLKSIDRVEVTFTEVKVRRQISRVVVATNGENTENPDGTKANQETAEQTEKDDGSIHSGVFRSVVSLVKADVPIAGNQALEAMPNDIIQITYLDERNMTDGVQSLVTKASVVEGNLGGVRVTQAEISDQELKVKTQLKTANALTNIGNRYKEFGLKKNAADKYGQALNVCEEILDDARRLGGRLLEETYVQLWQIYYEMDKLELAATMSQRLQREFPNSEFVDDALLQLAEVIRKQGDLRRAVGIYNRLLTMEGSQLQGEGQFGIAECYEQMAADAAARQGQAAAAQLYDKSFQEYKKVFDNFPESGRVGEAVAKMANFYYQQKDYSRAVDTFDNVLSNYPDAKFLDVILFNYGRCLYRMDRPAEARRMFDQLIGDYPESPLAADAKKIAEALRQKGF